MSDSHYTPQRKRGPKTNPEREAALREKKRAKQDAALRKAAALGRANEAQPAGKRPFPDETFASDGSRAQLYRQGQAEPEGRPRAAKTAPRTAREHEAARGFPAKRPPVHMRDARARAIAAAAAAPETHTTHGVAGKAARAGKSMMPPAMGGSPLVSWSEPTPFTSGPITSTGPPGSAPTPDALSALVAAAHQDSAFEGFSLDSRDAEDDQDVLVAHDERAWAAERTLSEVERAQPASESADLKSPVLSAVGRAQPPYAAAAAAATILSREATPVPSPHPSPEHRHATDPIIDQQWISSTSHIFQSSSPATSLDLDMPDLLADNLTLPPAPPPPSSLITFASAVDGSLRNAKIRRAAGTRVSRSASPAAVPGANSSPSGASSTGTPSTKTTLAATTTTTTTTTTTSASGETASAEQGTAASTSASPATHPTPPHGAAPSTPMPGVSVIGTLETAVLTYDQTSLISREDEEKFIDLFYRYANVFLDIVGDEEQSNELESNDVLALQKYAMLTIGSRHVSGIEDVSAKLLAETNRYARLLENSVTVGTARGFALLSACYLGSQYATAAHFANQALSIMQLLSHQAGHDDGPGYNFLLHCFLVVKGMHPDRRSMPLPNFGESTRDGDLAAMYKAHLDGEIPGRRVRDQIRTTTFLAILDTSQFCPAITEYLFNGLVQDGWDRNFECHLLSEEAMRGLKVILGRLNTLAGFMTRYRPVLTNGVGDVRSDFMCALITAFSSIILNAIGDEEQARVKADRVVDICMSCRSEFHLAPMFLVFSLHGCTAIFRRDNDRVRLRQCLDLLRLLVRHEVAGKAIRDLERTLAQTNVAVHA